MPAPSIDIEIQKNYKALYWKRNLVLKLKKMQAQGFNVTELGMVKDLWIKKGTLLVHDTVLMKKIMVKLRQDVKEIESLSIKDLIDLNSHVKPTMGEANYNGKA